MRTKSYWQQFQRQRISRRRLLATAGTGAAGLAVFAACNDNGGTSGDQTPGPGDGGEPQVGGRYVVAITGDWGTIDPVTSVSFGPGIFSDIYNALLDRSRIKTDYFYMDLAESYEQPDDSTYLFSIRPGVKIAPNSLGIEERDLDAMDAQVWLDRILADEAAVLRAFTNQWYDSHSMPDATHFQIKTKGPYAYFLFRIGPPLGGCIPPREFFEQNIDIKSQGVGAGPNAVIAAGSYSNTAGIILQRNPNYYRKDAEGRALPYLDEKESVRISDRQPRRTAFIDKQIHSYGAENRDEVEQLESEIADLLVTEEPANTFIAFTMNPEKEPWTDENIRKAAMYALNRQEFVDLVVGPEGGQIDGLVHWSAGDFALPPEELETLQPFDPEMSKQLIQQATGNDRITIKVMYPVSDIEFHDKHLPIWRQQMNAAGFDLDEDPQDFTTWLANYNELNYDSSFSLNQIYETAEIPIDFHAANGPQGDRHFAIGIGGLYPEIEAAITASKQSTDQAQHIEAVHEVQRMLYDKGPAFLPIMTWTAFTCYHPFVKNVPQGYGGTGQFLENEIWLDLEAMA
jgi:peptide/nickel transport system substrate-binding protein